MQRHIRKFSTNFSGLTHCCGLPTRRSMDQLKRQHTGGGTDMRLELLRWVAEEAYGGIAERAPVNDDSANCSYDFYVTVWASRSTVGHSGPCRALGPNTSSERRTCGAGFEGFIVTCLRRFVLPFIGAINEAAAIANQDLLAFRAVNLHVWLIGTHVRFAASRPELFMARFAHQRLFTKAALDHDCHCSKRSNGDVAGNIDELPQEGEPSRWNVVLTGGSTEPMVPPLFCP
jgi:hypothetical protein